jgi:hypothetical protein
MVLFFFYKPVDIGPSRDRRKIKTCVMRVIRPDAQAKVAQSLWYSTLGATVELDHYAG